METWFPFKTNLIWFKIISPKSSLTYLVSLATLEPPLEFGVKVLWLWWIEKQNDRGNQSKPTTQLMQTSSDQLKPSQAELSQAKPLAVSGRRSGQAAGLADSSAVGGLLKPQWVSQSVQLLSQTERLNIEQTVLTGNKLKRKKRADFIEAVRKTLILQLSLSLSPQFSPLLSRPVSSHTKLGEDEASHRSATAPPSLAEKKRRRRRRNYGGKLQEKTIFQRQIHQHSDVVSSVKEDGESLWDPNSCDTWDVLRPGKAKWARCHH